MIETNASNDVLVAFCHNGSVSSPFMNSLLGAFVEDAKRPVRRLVEYHDARGPYIHDNRSRIAKYFLEYTDYQWLWMLDNDIEFETDTLYRLIDVAERFDAKILGAAYWNQYEGYQCYLSWLLFVPDKGIRALPTLPNQEIAEVTAVGMGCTLIHRDVLQDVADSYPNDPWDTFAADILVQFEEGGMQIGRTPDDIEPGGRTVKKVERMGEDVTFCLRARRLGYPTFGAPSVVVEHHKMHKMIHGSSSGPVGNGRPLAGATQSRPTNT